MTIGWFMKASSPFRQRGNTDPTRSYATSTCPAMDGYAVCRALREQPLFEGTVIIAQTGWGQTQDRASTGESGFDHYLTKPVNMGRLGQC
jgi:DNA-binding response OmpR family regulator